MSEPWPAGTEGGGEPDEEANEVGAAAVETWEGGAEDDAEEDDDGESAPPTSAEDLAWRVEMLVEALAEALAMGGCAGDEMSEASWSPGSEGEGEEADLGEAGCVGEGRESEYVPF